MLKPSNYFYSDVNTENKQCIIQVRFNINDKHLLLYPLYYPINTEDNK